MPTKSSPVRSPASVIALVLLAVLLMIGCSSSGDGSANSSDDGSASSTALVAGEDAPESEPTDAPSTDSEAFGDATSDVTINDCGINDSGLPFARIQLTNPTDVTATYVVEITFEPPNDNQEVVETAVLQNVEAGGSRDEVVTTEQSLTAELECAVREASREKPVTDGN